MSHFFTALAAIFITLAVIDFIDYRDRQPGSSFSVACAKAGGAVAAYRLCLRPDAIINPPRDDRK